MLIQINTDDNVNPSDTLTKWVEATVRDILGRFADQVTRVEIHLSDENSDKKSGGFPGTVHLFLGGRSGRHDPRNLEKESDDPGGSCSVPV
ncbi:MAG: hypothetical protein EA346_13255, partial [Thioalkalivibrio sp.]